MQNRSEHPSVAQHVVALDPFRVGPEPAPSGDVSLPARAPVAGVLLPFVAVLFGLMWFFQSLVLPALFALVGVALVRPLFVWLRPRLGNGISAMMVSTLLLVVVSGFVGLIVILLQSEQEQLGPAFRQVEPTLQGLLASGRSMGLPVPTLDEAVTGGQVATALSSLGLGAGRVLSSVLLAYFLILLAYVEHDAWKTRINTLLGDDGERVIRNTLSRIRTYYANRTVACIASGTLSGLWLWALGVPSAPLWAVLIALLNYVPTLGSWIGAMPPVGIALATQGPGMAAAVAAGLFAQEQLVGNILDPLLQQRRLSLAPSVLLLSVVATTVLLGLPGAFFAGPLVLIAIAALEWSPRTEHLAALLKRV